LPFSLRYVAQMTWKERTPVLCGHGKVIDGWEKDFEYYWNRNPSTIPDNQQSLHTLFAQIFAHNFCLISCCHSHNGLLE